MRIAINTDNAAFGDLDEGADSLEVARILRELADRIERDGMPSKDNGYPIRDINGNTVGVCTSAPVKDYSNSNE